MKPLILVRGGGDIASGAIYRLRRAGYPVVVNEIAIPTMIRREVSYGNAVHCGEMILERLVARHVCIGEIQDTLSQGVIPVVTSSYEELLDQLHPDVVVDAILAKKNVGTTEARPIARFRFDLHNHINMNGTTRVAPVPPIVTMNICVPDVRILSACIPC